MKRERGQETGYSPISPDIMLLHNLNLARYGRSKNPDKHHDIFAYRVFDEEKIVIWSGLTSDGLMTIDASDKILKSLMKERPSVDPNTFRFFDIMTVRGGYDYIGKGKRHITEIKFFDNGEEWLRPNIKNSELPPEIGPIIDILANP